MTGAMNGAATALSWKPSLLRHADLLGLASLAFCFASGLLYKSAARRFALFSFRGTSQARLSGRQLRSLLGMIRSLSSFDPTLPAGAVARRASSWHPRRHAGKLHSDRHQRRRRRRRRVLREKARRRRDGLQGAACRRLPDPLVTAVLVRWRPALGSQAKATAAGGTSANVNAAAPLSMLWLPVGSRGVALHSRLWGRGSPRTRGRRCPVHDS